MLLEEKVAIITGASSGIGRAAAFAFATEGASVVLSGRRRASLDEVVRAIGASAGRAIAVLGDVRDESHAVELVAAAVDTFGGLDIAFNNAGALGTVAAIPELTAADWDDTIRANLTSAFLGAKHQIPALLRRGGGSLVFTSSFVGHTAGFPGLAAYASAKAGLVGLVQVIATEFGVKGIRANALVPGGVDTPSNAANLPGATAETRSFVEGLHALKRLGRAEEIARAAVFLASSNASFITGAALIADGGVSISRT